MAKKSDGSTVHLPESRGVRRDRDGLLAAFLWVRSHRTKLVDRLGFFNGRRLVPIIMAFVAIVFAALCPWVRPPAGDALEHFGNWLSDRGAWGAGVFGVADRALL